MRLLFILIPFILSLQIATGQDLYFNNITTREGLPSSECYGFLHDSKGFLWIRTLNGLSKFNGTKFKTFTTSNGLKSNEIYSLCEDKSNRIWFATSTSHIGYIYNDSVNYIPCSETLAAENGFGQKVLHQIVCDEGNNLYISSHENAYKIFANQNYSSFEILGQNKYFLKIVEVNKSLFSIPDTTRNLNHYSNSTFYFNVLGVSKTINWPRDDVRQGMMRNPFPCKDQFGNVFFIINNKLYCLKSNGDFLSYEFDNLIYHIFIDKNNNLWTGCNNEGLWLFRNADISSKPISVLNNISISGIVQDFEGGIWVSSLSKGLFYCKNLFSRQWAKISGLSEKPQMLKSLNNKIYFADFRNFLGVIDPACNSAKRYFLPFEKSKIGLLDIDPIRDGFILSGRNSLFMVSPQFTLIDRIWRDKTNMISAGSYNTIVTESEEIIGVSKNFCTNFSKGTSIRLPSFGNDIVKFGHHLLTASKNGLFLINENADPRSRLIIGNKNFIKLINLGNFLYAIGKDGSIYRLDNQLNYSLFVSLEKGINDACSKGPNEIICCGFDGIVVLNTLNRSLHRIGLEDGLLDAEIFKVAYCNGLLFYGTSQGIGSFDVEGLAKKSVSPRIVLNGLTINQKKSYSLPEFIPFDANITFHFTPISFKSSQSPKINYFLKGYNAQWIKSENSELVFNHLPEGNYRLEVFVGTTNNSKSETLTFEFKVPTPFYRTVIFRLLVVVFLLAIFFLITRFIYFTIRRQEEKKTRINKMLAEYQLMGLKAQMNPHFIFNCLNSIQKYILDNNSKEAYTYMAKFSKLIRFILDISDKTFISLSEEIELVKVYVELEQMRFKNKFNFVLKGFDDWNMAELLVPSLIIQPYLENAIWHGIMNLPPHKQGTIEISFDASGLDLKIVIQDNGAGRKFSESQNRHKHLSKSGSINQKRIQAINHLLENKNAKISIEDLSLENGEPGGTKVIISLPKQYE